MWRSWVRAGVGVLLGSGIAFVELAYLLLSGGLVLLASPLPWARRAVIRAVEAGARRLAEIERSRLARFHGAENGEDYAGVRAVAYLVLHWPVGLLGGLMAALFLYGVMVGAVWSWQFLTGESSIVTYASQVLLSAVLLFLSVQGFAGFAALERRLARRFLGPSDRERLERRITELASSRAGIVAAVDAERRRIERDLHDGVQQRLVALGVLLGRARRTEGDSDLLRQAHDEARQILGELRDVAWRAYPAALDHLGLEEALLRVTERAGVSARLHYQLTEPLPGHVRTAAYFIVSEAVTNAVKHAGAHTVDVTLSIKDDAVLVRVTDDGVGGADPTGGGLAGLARRVSALDGRFEVDSPAGGPTRIVAELPCA